MCKRIIYEGLGIDIRNIFDKLDPKKIRTAGTKINIEPSDYMEWRRLDNSGRMELLYSKSDTPFWFADVLCKSDPKKLLSYAQHDAACYLIYGPCLPWEEQENECRTEDMARRHIYDIVMAFTLSGVGPYEIMNEIVPIGDLHLELCGTSRSIKEFLRI